MELNFNINFEKITSIWLNLIKLAIMHMKNQGWNTLIDPISLDPFQHTLFFLAQSNTAWLETLAFAPFVYV